MGGGFGSKFGPDAQGIICAKLAKQAGAAVKLMLDRKDEHLAVGQPPVVGVEDQGGRQRRRHADGVRRRDLGHGRRRRRRPASRCRTSTSSRTGGGSHATSTPTPVRQRAMRAPGHPQGCFHTEMLMDELADKLRMDPLAFRIKNLPPEAPNAMWRKYFPMAAEQFRLEQAPRHRRSDAGTDQARHGLRRQPLGRRRAGHEGALRDQLPDGSVVMRCGTQDIGVGTKTIVTMITAETLGIPMTAREERRSATATIRSAAGPAAARPRRPSRRPFASPPARRSTS